ncbi:MAG: apolipoprotein N-acyltransferase [Lentisphaeria bacterium]|nr:apolipoprotein N-acyltransferase [Candidatus Neomarinimicrobiota bacterium]MCF7842397.1 apolipoprotein N-acyltransferase [Lentisphaeria bacterium]
MAILTGLLLAFSFPPFDLSFLAWFAWIPLWLALERANWRHGFRLGYISGVVFTLVTLNWIANNSGTTFWVASASMVGSILYLSIYYGLFGFLMMRGGRLLGRRAFLFAPLVWTGVEYIYSWGFMGFPWLSLAMTQNLFLPLQQFAEVGGIYMVSFWVLMVNTAIYAIEFLHLDGRQQQRAWLVLTGFLVVSFAVGGVRMWMVQHRDGPTIKVGAVQSNVDPHDKWVRSKKQQHVEDLLLKSDLALVDGAKVVIWPETAVPAYLMYYASLFNMIEHYVNRQDISILTGSLHHERQGDDIQTYNAAFFFAPDSAVKLYYKQHLVPFAERLPLVDLFPGLKVLNFGQANFAAGKQSSVYSLGSRDNKARFGTMICYESSDPVLFRRFVRNGAQVMTIITNDGWLGRSLGPYQHLALARFRAIEHRIPVVRSAQTGISAFVSPSGMIHHRIPLNQDGYFVVDAPLHKQATPYTRWGDWFGIFMLIGMLVWTGWVFFSRRRM